MRRLFLTACMLLCLVCGLCACKSDAVKTVERQISEIVVSENSGKAIAASRAAYDALTEDEKNAVANYDSLVEAEEAYDQIFADKVTEVITKIGAIDENSGPAIASARDAYDNLTKSQKQLVANFDSLISAEKDYETYIVQYCGDLIQNLTGDAITSEAIEKAVSTFDALPDTQKREVKNTYPDAEQIIENAYSKWTVSLIEKIEYKSGMPSKEMLRNLIDAKKAYDGLNAAQKEAVTNSGLLEKSLKAFQKFCDSREKTDTIYAKHQYIGQSKNVTYETLVDYPTASKGQQIVLEVTIENVEKGIFSSSIQAFAGGDTEKPVFLVDNRKVKEPILKIGDTLTVYGTPDGTDTVTITEENSGWFGTNFLNKKTGEYIVPIIKIFYTNQESPFEQEHPLDSEQEEMIVELLQIINK